VRARPPRSRDADCHVWRIMKIPIEKTARVLAITFIIALLVSTMARLRFSASIGSISTISYWVIAMVAVVVRIGCGRWLYKTTKPKRQHPWLWCLLGAVFGLMAVATYFVIEIYKIVSVGVANDEPDLSS